jgi:chemotaxis response regulator CheB
MKRLGGPKQKRNAKPRARPRKTSKAAAAFADDSFLVKEDSEDEGSEPAIGPAVPVVGIGASAGGLEAFSEILDTLGAEPQVALVFVQHLAPQHESALPALLGGRTRMPVVQVKRGLASSPTTST